MTNKLFNFIGALFIAAMAAFIISFSIGLFTGKALGAESNQGAFFPQTNGFCNSQNVVDQYGRRFDVSFCRMAQYKCILHPGRHLVRPWPYQR